MRARHDRHAGADRTLFRGATQTLDVMIVFDMDGVLTEVSESYREAIVQTVAHFTGRTITRDLIQQYKNRGGWNNDWALSQQIAADFGVDLAYEDVIAQFNRLFLGAH